MPRKKRSNPEEQKVNLPIHKVFCGACEVESTVNPDGGKSCCGNKPDEKLPQINTKICKRPACGNSFIPGRYWQAYCGNKCKTLHWQELHPRVKTEVIIEEK